MIVAVVDAAAVLESSTVGYGSVVVVKDGSRQSKQMLATLLNLRDDPESLVSRITLQVAKDIIEGVVAPGETMNSLELAKRFASSRSPVRDALLALEREGLIEVPARRRPRVVAPTLEQVVEIYELRAQLHSTVARKVARNASISQLDELDAALQAMGRSAVNGDVDGYFWGNVSFHHTATAIAGDSTLKRTLDGLGLQVLRLRHLGMSLPGRMAVSYEDHQRLARAYRERDEDLAGALSSSIILAALKALRHWPEALPGPMPH